jgi:hypothetical protein
MQQESTSSAAVNAGGCSVPEWWGLLVNGNLVQVIRWREATRPTLADFNVALPNGADYTIDPVGLTTSA